MLSWESSLSMGVNSILSTLKLPKDKTKPSTLVLLNALVVTKLFTLIVPAS